MEQVVILGGGGHAKVIIEIVQAAGLYEIAGCTAGDPGAASILGVPVLGDDACLPAIYALGVRRAFVAVGDNRLRQRLTRYIAGLGFQLVNAVSPHAVVSPAAALCAGVAIMPGAVINSCSRLGNGTIINTSATVDHDCEIADWAHIAPGTNLAGCVKVGEGAFLGIGSRVIPKVSIGAWSVVGAGAVVIHDLPPGVTAVGVPATIADTRQ
jgi:UDP-perosamine 4-acetyltransferase